MTLRQRILRAGIWTTASYGVELSTRLLSNLVMTRLLFPDAFGMIAAAMALIVGLQLLSDFGVRAVIVQSPRGEEISFLRSSWTFQLSRGLFLWVVLAVVCTFLGLPIIHSILAPASVFANPSFPAIVGVLGLSIIISGSESTAISLNMRRLNFRPIAALDLATRIAPLPIMITWAYFYPTVWSIIAGTLTGSIVRAILSHFLVPGPRMGFEWRKEHIREIVTFGKWINLSSIATFVGSQTDVIALGLIVPGPMLGTYYIAKTLSDSIEAFLERLNSTMTLSVLGEIVRNNPNNLKDRYYRFRLPLEFVAASSAGFLLTAGEWIVRMLYDQRYSDAGPMLQILSFGLLIYPFQLIRSGFTATGKANVVAWISIIQAISLIICLGAGFHFFGTIGAISGIALSRIFPSIVILTLAHRERWISFSKELRWIVSYALGLVIGVITKYAFSSFHLSNIRHLFG
jgi:O-antigen/teichoic acid export membrane protein